MARLRAVGLLVIVLLLVSSAFAEPTRIRDVIYGRKFGTALTMDVIKPEKQSGIGVVVMVSGGFSSSREMADGFFTSNILKSLLDHGDTLFLVIHGSQPKYVVAVIIQDI